MRARNVGFVKVEQNDEESTIHMHGKGMHIDNGERLDMYLFYETDGKFVKVFQEDVILTTASLNYQLNYAPENVGGREVYDKIGGALIESAKGKRFAAVWESEIQIDVDHMATPEEMTAPENGTGQEEAEAAEEALPESEPEEEETEEPEMQEITVSETEKCVWKATKIQRKELSILPRCEWRLANNNFVMHGYYNYHHLVLLDNGSILKLGVPGIYHEKEAAAARAFGFPEFVDREEITLTLQAEECREEERFGYWCRQVRRPVV